MRGGGSEGDDGNGVGVRDERSGVLWFVRRGCDVGEVGMYGP